MASSARQTVLGGLVVVLLVAAGVIYYVRSTHKPGPPAPTHVDGVCVACATDVQEDVPAGTALPLICPHCKEQTVYAWWFCEDCKKLFVPKLIQRKTGGPPQPDRQPACPGCRSAKVMTYTAARMLDYQPVGRLPLPAKEGVPAASDKYYPPSDGSPPASGPASGDDAARVGEE